MKLYYRKNELQKQFCDWRFELAPNVAITYTLKQGLPLANGLFQSIKEEDIVKTMWFLRDRLAKKILGTKKYKQGKRLTFLCFQEGDGRNIRFHVHIAAFKPPEISLREYRKIHENIARKLDWIYTEARIEEAYDPQGWIGYSVSRDLNSFLPQCSESRSFITQR